MHEPIDYLNPQLPAGLAQTSMPIVSATNASLTGYGRLIDDAASCPIEIVRWPSLGTRPVDVDTGDQGGTTAGIFVSEWRGDILYGRNEAVGGHYILAYGCAPDFGTSAYSLCAAANVSSIAKEPCMPGFRLISRANSAACFTQPSFSSLVFALDCRRPL